MSVTDFFQYLADDERTAGLATQLVDAYRFRQGTATLKWTTRKAS
jgi:hypothetical protein